MAHRARGVLVGAVIATLLGTATCAHRATVRGSPYTEYAVELDGGRCSVTLVALTTGHCGVHVETESGAKRYLLSSLACGETRSYCGAPQRCDCTSAVTPYPCEPSREDDFPRTDTAYSRDEYAERWALLEPSEPEREANVELDGGASCAYVVSPPRYGACPVRGATIVKDTAAEWFDVVPFGTVKRLPCGVEATCGCR